MKTSYVTWLSWSAGAAALLVACGNPDLEPVDRPASVAPAPDPVAVAADEREPEPPAIAIGDGLARTPPMGFNDWNAFGCNVSEQLI